MADLSLNWKGDFDVSPTGDILLADGDQLAQQRIQRRLFTQVKGYIYHLPYGAGMPQKIGGTMRLTQIRALVVSQVGQETSVSQSPPPSVTVVYDKNNTGLYIVTISYTSVVTGKTVSFQLQV